MAEEETAKKYERLTAYRVKLKDLLNTKYVKEENAFEYLEFKNVKVSRVRVIATIVSKKVNDEGSYAYVVLDDGTETMRVKCWKDDVQKLEKPLVGDIVEIIGRVREWSGERYITCETLHVVNEPNHWLFHQYELLMGREKFERVEEKEETGKSTGVEKKEPVNISREDLVLKIIRENDIGKGTSLALVKKESGLEESELKTVLSALLNDSVIYEPQKNSYKILDA